MECAELCLSMPYELPLYAMPTPDGVLCTSASTFGQRMIVLKTNARFVFSVVDLPIPLLIFINIAPFCDVYGCGQFLYLRRESTGTSTSLAQLDNGKQQWRMSFAYQSMQRFLRVEKLARHHRFGIAGIPYDGSTTNRTGARFGPSAIRQSSSMLCDGIHPFFNVTPLSNDLLGDAGDLSFPSTSIVSMRERLQQAVMPLLHDHHMAFLGGDHSITLPLLRCYAERFGRRMAVIHFDAHCDTWAAHSEYDDEHSGHGTWVFEAFNERLVQNECFFQIGLRSPGERSTREYVSDRGGLIYSARDLRGRENASHLSDVVSSIRQRLANSGNPPLYLSFDIDCLDPAFAPGTGTPEPAGLTSNQVFTLLEEFSNFDFVGMDCVEVAPAYDHAELTSYAAANVVWTYLCGQIVRLKL